MQFEAMQAAKLAAQGVLLLAEIIKRDSGATAMAPEVGFLREQISSGRLELWRPGS